MGENTEILGQDDVIKVDEQQKGFMPHTTFTADDITSKIRSEISQRYNPWKNDSVEADVLVAGKSWRKGKLRLRIEFIPDEVPIESLLDEFRNK